MTYSISISGHVDTDEQEWTLLQQVASLVQEAKATSAVASTQFHGQVDLLMVQVLPPVAAESVPASTTEPVPVADTPPVEPVDHPVTADETVKDVEQPDGSVATTVFNAAGEVVGYR